MKAHTSLALEYFDDLFENSINKSIYEADVNKSKDVSEHELRCFRDLVSSISHNLTHTLDIALVAASSTNANVVIPSFKLIVNDVFKVNLNHIENSDFVHLEITPVAGKEVTFLQHFDGAKGFQRGFELYDETNTKSTLVSGVLAHAYDGLTIVGQGEISAPNASKLILKRLQLRLLPFEKALQ